MQIKIITLKTQKNQTFLKHRFAGNHISYTARGGNYPTHKDTYDMYSSNINLTLGSRTLTTILLGNNHRTSLYRYKLLHLMAKKSNQSFT